MKEEERKETIKEARILEALRHPNIIKFREVYKTKKGRLCIVMDYADGKIIVINKLIKKRWRLSVENKGFWDSSYE